MADHDMDGQPDMFAPLSEVERASTDAATGAGAADGEIWQPIMPAPSEPPPAAQIKHRKYGPATQAWVYRNATGEPMFATVRFDSRRPDGTLCKEVLPYTWGDRAWRPSAGPKAGELTARTGWHFKRPSLPVPLYGLDRLSAKPDAPVLVCEGEKTADAAAALFPDLACMTSQGGSAAAANADWSLLAGRDVTVWPDNDGPGTEYASAVAQQLAGIAGARSVRVVAVPAQWPEGWDLADALPEGVVPETLAELPRAARLASARQSGGTGDVVAAGEVVRVAGLDELEYARQRVEVAKTLAIRVGDLDRLRAQSRMEARAAEITGTIGEGGVPTDARGRTALFIDDADLPDSAASLAVELAKRERLFDRGGPCRLVHDPERGGSTIKPLDISGVVNECHAVCRPYRLRMARDGNPKRSDVTLPERVAKLYLSMDGRWGLRPLDGIALAPLLKADGSIRVIEGYDPPTRLWCERVPAVEVPDAPAVDDARAALLRVRMIFRTFAFADSKHIAVPGSPVTVVDLDRPPGADESAFLVMLLTAVCRPSLRLAPGMLVHGPEISGGGTGKGLLVRAMCIIAFGVQPKAMTLGEDRGELDRRITAALIGAEPMVYLDNVNGIALKSDILASAITERPAEVRPLGSSTRVLLNSSSMITVAGNGLRLAEDLTRRFITVGLDARMENPENRAFTGNFLATVESAREQLLRDLLTIWRWGRQRGDALPRGQALGSFEDWGRWCRDSLVALGCADPVARMAKSKAADPQRAHIAELFSAWWERHGDKLVTVTKLHDAVQRIADPVGKGRQFLATLIRNLDGTRVAGYLLTHVPAIGKWSADLYQLTTTDDATRQTGIGGIGDADTQAAAKRSGTADDPATRIYSSMEAWEEDEKKL